MNNNISPGALIFIMILCIVVLLALDFLCWAGIIYVACLVFGLEFQWTGALWMWVIGTILITIFNWKQEKGEEDEQQDRN